MTAFTNRAKRRLEQASPDIGGEPKKKPIILGLGQLALAGKIVSALGYVHGSLSFDFLSGALASLMTNPKYARGGDNALNIQAMRKALKHNARILDRALQGIDEDYSSMAVTAHTDATHTASNGRKPVLAEVPKEIAALGFDSRGRLYLAGTKCCLEARLGRGKLSVSLCDAAGAAYREASMDLFASGTQRYIKACKNVIPFMASEYYDEAFNETYAEIESGYEDDDESDTMPSDAQISREADNQTTADLKNDKEYNDILKLQKNSAAALKEIQTACEGLMKLYGK